MGGSERGGEADKYRGSKGNERNSCRDQVALQKPHGEGHHNVLFAGQPWTNAALSKHTGGREVDTV